MVPYPPDAGPCLFAAPSVPFFLLTLSQKRGTFGLQALGNSLPRTLGPLAVSCTLFRTWAAAAQETRQGEWWIPKAFSLMNHFLLYSVVTHEVLGYLPPCPTSFTWISCTEMILLLVRGTVRMKVTRELLLHVQMLSWNNYRGNIYFCIF